MQHDGAFTPFSFLNKLQLNEWQTLQAIAHTIQYKKNDYIFRASEINNSLYILLDGRVKISRLSQHGRELIQWFCLPGEIFGLSEDSFSHHRGLYAQALTNTRILCIQKTDFEHYIQIQPRVSLLIIKQLSSRLRTLGDTLLNITSDDAQARFIKLLQRLSKFYGREYEDGIHVDIYLTHQEMADMIGVCRQTVSSMIGLMKKQGVMVMNRKGIFIQSPGKLYQLDLEPKSLETSEA